MWLFTSEPYEKDENSKLNTFPKALKFVRLILCLCLLLAPATLLAAEQTKPRLAEIYRIGSNAYVRALAVDQSRGSLWVGTSVGAMEVDLNSQNLKGVHTRKEGLANEYVFAIGVDPKGSVWLGTNAGGVSKSKPGGGWKTYFPMHGLADFWVYSIIFDKDGNAWMGTWDGASYLPAGSEKFENFREQLINIWVYGIDIDAKGQVWMGTEGGVSMYNHGIWSSWTHDDGLGAANEENLLGSANTGLGTRSRHDLSVTSGTGKKTYNPNYVFAAKVDNQTGKIWFGTWGGGASEFDGNDAWRNLTVKDGLAGNIVYSIAQEKDGTLWFGTNKGASRYDGKTWQTFDRRSGLIGDNVFAIAIDPNNEIWLGTKGGVSRLTYSAKTEKGK